MIAAPMTTRNSLSYRELAKAEAVVKRVVSSDELVRLSQAAVAVGATHAEFSFEFTDNGRPRVTADIASEASLACQWCLEPKGIALSTKFTAVLAQDEAQARQWSEEALNGAQPTPDVIVTGTEFDAVRLIEDELILSLPNQVCIDQQCPNRPESQFGDADEDKNENGETGTRDNPFAVLEALKSEAPESGAREQSGE